MQTVAEQLQFDVTVNKTEHVINKLNEVFLDIKLEEDETATIKYTIDLVYLGRVHERLSKLLELKKAGVIVNASIKELTNGKCLFEEVLKTLREFDRDDQRHSSIENEAQ